MSTLHQVMLVMLILCFITLLVTPSLIAVRIERANTCRDAGYVDYLKWDGVSYCVKGGETSDELVGVKYEVVVE